MSETTVRCRGIYTTALTRRFHEREGTAVVDASEPIRDRFDATFPVAPADAEVWTTDDRQGVGVAGTLDPVLDVLTGTGIDTLAWRDPAPRGLIADGRVTETRGGGALVDLGDATGYLPFSNADDRVETGDRYRVQVAEPNPPWSGDRAVLDTDISIGGDARVAGSGRRWLPRRPTGTGRPAVDGHPGRVAGRLGQGSGRRRSRRPRSGAGTGGRPRRVRRGRA
ncbi:hypothetical protein GJ629_14635, partial [Halapricum sp. CBA1109]|nr:hypothetical protein [Halapricum sp. CBA1109]